jgi:hypothetical protein
MDAYSHLVAACARKTVSMSFNMAYNAEPSLTTRSLMVGQAVLPSARSTMRL